MASFLSSFSILLSILSSSFFFLHLIKANIITNTPTITIGRAIAKNKTVPESSLSSSPPSGGEGGIKLELYIIGSYTYNKGRSFSILEETVIIYTPCSLREI